MRHPRTLVLGFALVVGCIQAWAGVTITSPVSGSTVSSPVQLNATLTGTPTAISVYDNNVLVASPQPASSVQVPLTLASGSHTLQVTATYPSRRRGSVSSATTTITVGGATTTTTTPPASLAAQIADDMIGTNEGNPQGVPLSWDFAVGPVAGLGNNPPSGWTAATAWGVIYAASQGNPATNTRVNIRNMQLYILSASTGQWSLLQNTSQPDGDAYMEDFSGSPISADVRTEPDGTISVTAGMGTWAGRNFHFYPSDRGSFAPNDVAGVVSTFEARLIVGNPSLPDDRSAANYLGGAGADYWPSVTGSLPASYDGVTPPIDNGKMKYVQVNWRSFCSSSLTEAQLQSNPPPINFSGILP